MGWLFEAKKRYGLCLLNYVATSNHVHLRVLDGRSGYAEIQEARERCSIIDHRALMYLLGIPSIDAMRRLRKTWVEEALGGAEQTREGKWTESIAVGSRNFVEMVKGELRIKAKGRRISGTDEESGLRQSQDSYSNDFDGNNGLLSTKNGCFLETNL